MDLSIFDKGHQVILTLKTKLQALIYMRKVKELTEKYANQKA